jgi:hypothetical protein
MKQLFIPPLGTELELGEDWSFPLFHEYRNRDFFTYQKLKYFPTLQTRETDSEPSILPAGTRLKVYRIYIRRGQTNFDSVTFIMTQDASGKKVTRQRFWVKLADANRMIIKDT